MKAFINGIDVEGKDILGTDFPRGGKVTNEYKNFDNLVRYALKGYKGLFRIVVFYNWDNRYSSKADIDQIIKV